MKKIVFVVLLLPLLMTGCKQMELLDEEITVLTKLKNELSISGPYSYEEHEKLSDYFSGLNLLVKKIDDHPKGKEGLAKYLKKNGLVNLCRKVLISEETWGKIQENCWKGEYFVCSEDVLEFQGSIEQFVNNLEGGNKQEFLSNEACAGSSAE